MVQKMYPAEIGALNTVRKDSQSLVTHPDFFQKVDLFKVSQILHLRSNRETNQKIGVSNSECILMCKHKRVLLQVRRDAFISLSH